MRTGAGIPELSWKPTEAPTLGPFPIQPGDTAPVARELSVAASQLDLFTFVPSSSKGRRA